MQWANTFSLRHFHRERGQIRTRAGLEFDRDLWVACSLKLCFQKNALEPSVRICRFASRRKKRLSTSSIVSEKALISGNGVRRHHVVAHYGQLSWHSQKRRKKERKKASCKHLLREAFISAPNLHTTVWAVLAEPILRTLTARNSWTNERTQNKKYMHDQNEIASQRARLCGSRLTRAHLSSYSTAQDVHNALTGLSAMRGAERLSYSGVKKNHFNMLRRLRWINVEIQVFGKAT